MPKFKDCPLQILIAIDQLANTFVGGWADESLSAHAWRCKDKSLLWKYTRAIVDMLFFWEHNHCASAYDSEAKRLHMPVELRD